MRIDTNSHNAAFIHRSDNSITRRTLTPLSCRVVKNDIFLFTLFIEYMSNITVYSNKDFVDWILLLGFDMLRGF